MTPGPHAVAEFGEIAVVLGGGLERDGTPAAATIARADAAARLARERPDLAVICSGSHGVGRRAGRSEASWMAERIEGAGIDRERLFLEEESRDTIGNAVFVTERFLAAVAPRPLFIVTSPFHLERSLETFGLALGPSWRIAGVASDAVDDDAQRAKHEPHFLAQTREYFASHRRSPS